MGDEKIIALNDINLAIKGKRIHVFASTSGSPVNPTLP